MADSKHVPLPGTEHIAPPEAHEIGPTEHHQMMEVSVLLKHRQPLPSAAEKRDHIEKIRQFARKYSLQVLERGDEAQRRTVTLAGTAADMEKAFGVELHDYEHPEGTYRGHAGPIRMPEEYASLVAGVFGLDDRPVAHPHFRYRTNSGAFGARRSSLAFNPQQVGELYGFPTGLDVSGQTIAILELGGGYRPHDIKNYFKALGLHAPKVKSVLVDHAHNRPSTPDSADGEVMLDIEVAGAVAPGVHIAVYFAPNTARGFQDAISTAVHNQLNKPSVISISWGGPENGWSTQSMLSFDQVAQEAALLGISVTAASGDSGSSDGVDDGQNHVDFPASSPHVLACGGTRLLAQNNTIKQETVWNDGAQGGAGGGGYSSEFARPDWQAADVSNSHRGVPDVSGDADPETGYNVLVDGQNMVVGGTSAVAPLWAGLIVLLNQKLNKRLGFLNPLLYPIAAGNGFKDITQGNNGAYSAGPGWDAASGKGSPMATQLAASLGAAAGAAAATQAKKTVPAS